MASRVNVKFVVILSASLVALTVAVGGAFVWVKWRSGERLYKRGEEAITQGDYTAADLYLSKAVNKERTNVEYLNAWRKARENKVPESLNVFQDEYAVYVYGILRQLAIVQNTDVNAHREYLEAIYQQRVNFGADREAWLHLATEADKSLAYFTTEQPPALRRYRGLALGAMVIAGMDLPADRAELAMEDLEAAVEADPKDARAALELVSLHAAHAERSRRDNPELRAEHLEAAEQVLTRAVAANPEDPSVLLAELRLRASKISEKFDGMNTAEARQARADALEELKPDLDALASKLQAAGGKRLNTSAVFHFLSLASAIDPQNALQTATQIAERTLESDPDDADLLMLAAQMSSYAGNFDRAIEIYGRIENLPRLPVGLDGLKLFNYRTAALVGQADAAISLIATTTEAGAREQAIARAEGLRAKAAQSLPAESMELAFIDGKLLFLKNDFRGAQRKLDQVLKANAVAPAKMMEAIAIMADIGMRLDPPQPGLTREYLQRAIALQPGRIDLRINLANVEITLGNDRVAADMLREVLSLNPNDERAKLQLELIQARLNEGSVSDPVLATMVQVDRLLTGDRKMLIDEAGAVKLLQDSLEKHAYDQRIVVRLASLLIYQNRQQDAIALLEEAVKRHPDNEVFKRFQKQVNAASSLEGSLAIIESNNDIPPLERELAKNRIYATFNKPEEAQASLARAAQIAPEDPRVIEMLFLSAMNRKDLAEAGRLADIAVRTDADRTEGDTFRARLLLAQNNPSEAATLLQRAAERGNANAAIYRLLGLTYLQLNRGPEAVTALREALRLNPNDSTILRTLIAAQVQLGNPRDALATARGSDTIVRRDPELRNMWLGLEAMAGNADLAVDLREQILSKYPEDYDNAAALADVYISRQNWQRSRELIDRLRKERDSLALLTLDANWHAARGDVETGRRIFIEKITELSKTPGLLNTEPFVAMAQFLLRNGRPAHAIEALENAAQAQDPKTMPMDRMIAEIHLRTGQFAQAETVLRKILQAGVEDPQLEIRKRLIESLIQQGKTDEVTREFAILGDQADRDVELMCLHAQQLRTSGDNRAAREMLDRAVAKHPQDPLPYYRRARMLMTDTRLRGDALADLASAIRLRPGNALALRTRGFLQLADGRTSEALADFRAAAEANPSLDLVWGDLLRLMLDMNNNLEARQTAERAADQRTNDWRFALFVGDIFAQEKDWATAAQFYKRVWDQQRNEANAVRYISAMLDAKSPRLGDVESVLNAPELQTPKSSTLLMLRACVRKEQKKIETARADALAALQLAASSPQQVLTWGEQLARVFPEPGAAAQFIAGLSSAPEPLRPWLSLSRASNLLASESTRESGIEALRDISRNGTDPAARQVAIRMLSGHYATAKQWAEALEITQLGLTLAEDDVMLLNNAAYFLAQLGKGSEALPLAEKAVAAAPEQAAVVDTLASAYWAIGERAKALETLEKASRLSGSDSERLSLRLKLGKWRLENGERESAARILNEVQEILIESPALAESVREPLDTLTQKLGAS